MAGNGIKREGVGIPLDLSDSHFSPTSLAARLEADSLPGRDCTIVEIQENKLCIYPSNGSPMYLDIKQAWKVLPELVKFLSQAK